MQSKTGDQDVGYNPVMRELAESQFVLFAYICMLTGRSQDARDILQDANVTICRESARYDPTRPFLPWAKTIAYYQVRTHRRKQQRDRLVLDDDMLELVAADSDVEAQSAETELRFLDGCIDRLPEPLRQVVKARYLEQVSVTSLARQLGRSPNAISLLLMRARQALAECVGRMSAEEGLA